MENITHEIILPASASTSAAAHNESVFDFQLIESMIKQSVEFSRAGAKVTNYVSPVTILFLTVMTGLIVTYNRKRARMVQLIGKIPGPPSLPLVGNAIESNVDHDEMFARLTGVRKLWGRRQGIAKAWMGTMPYVFVSDASKCETIMGSPKHIDKSRDYDFLQPWLGTGLLTSQGHKWHTRRKILTPAFHFKILEDFIDVFQEQSALLVQKMEAEVDQESFNLFPYVTLCTLDIICETAMGRSINAQEDSESDYVKAVYEIGSIVQTRQSNMLLQPDWMFRLSSLYHRHKQCKDILHGFSYRMIGERKQEIARQQEELTNNNNNNNDDAAANQNLQQSGGTDDSQVFGRKKRLAFLDLLIEASQNGTVLTNEDIREEVDTFMFEGHDTTSAAISWSLFLLASDPVIQDKVVREIDDVMGGDRRRPPSMKELMEMKYLECVIKEALRLYPSVPMIARKIKEDVLIGEYLIPAGTTAMILTYQLHRDPNVFPKPEQFNPDHFLPENCYGRHPYAYIPFSAGPRNCIGQKFAILEEKSVIAAVLRNYRIEAIDRREDLTLLGELILRPKDGLRVRITRRD